MKKYNEGYVMPMVMVVLIVLCAVSLSVLSPALSNLKTQEHSTLLMTERYAAIYIAKEAIDEVAKGHKDVALTHEGLTTMADNKEWMKSYVDSAWSSVKTALQGNSISSSAECPTDISLKEGVSGIQYEITIPGTYCPSLSRTEHGYMPTVALSVDCKLIFELFRSSENGTETGFGTCKISVSSNSNSRSYTITTGGSIDG